MPFSLDIDTRHYFADITLLPLLLFFFFFFFFFLFFRCCFRLAAMIFFRLRFSTLLRSAAIFASAADFAIRELPFRFHYAVMRHY